MAQNNLLFNICQQRRRAQMFPIPPSRTELESSPYNTPINGNVYTQHDIDMRRKAEILKYNSNKVSTQTNNLTKYQKFSLLVNGYTQSIPQSISTDLTIQRACPADALIPTPTSSSDIPGPVIMLVDNESVPLYNYVNPTYTRSYSTLPPNNTDLFSIVYNENTKYSIVDLSATVSSIYIREAIDRQFTTFQLNIPIGIYASGDISNNTGSNISIRISSVKLNVFYNDTIVTTSYGITAPTIVTNFLDVSFNVNRQQGTFSLVQYVGSLKTNNLKLATTIGTIYDIKLSFNYSIQSGIEYTRTKYIKNFNYGVYAGLSSNLINVSQNCNVTSLPASSYSKMAMISQM